MKSAFLRGFDFPSTDIDYQLRLCNPLVSFQDGTLDPVYYVRNLNWAAENVANHDQFTPVQAEEIDRFATELSEPAREIAAGQGVVLIGGNLMDALTTAGIEMPHQAGVEFRKVATPRCWIAVASIAEYEELADSITRQALLVADDEIAVLEGRTLSAAGEAALLVLRKSGWTRMTDLSNRQLAIAKLQKRWDLYRRLLKRFSLALKESEDDLDREVDRFLAFRSVAPCIRESARKIDKSIEILLGISFPYDSGATQRIGKKSLWTLKDKGMETVNTITLRESIPAIDSVSTIPCHDWEGVHETAFKSLAQGTAKSGWYTLGSGSGEMSAKKEDGSQSPEVVTSQFGVRKLYRGDRHVEVNVRRVEADKSLVIDRSKVLVTRPNTPESSLDHSGQRQWVLAGKSLSRRNIDLFSANVDLYQSIFK